MALPTAPSLLTNPGPVLSAWPPEWLPTSPFFPPAGWLPADGVDGITFRQPVLAAEVPKEDAAKKDLEKMQGSWVLVSLEEDGKTATEARAKEFRLSLAGDKYTFTVGGETAKGVYKLDPAKKPKALDIVVEDGPHKGKTKLAIYDFDGDNLKMAVAEPGNDRPRDFSPGKGYDVEVWKRAKP